MSSKTRLCTYPDKYFWEDYDFNPIDPENDDGFYLDYIPCDPKMPLELIETNNTTWVQRVNNTKQKHLMDCTGVLVSHRFVMTSDFCVSQIEPKAQCLKITQNVTFDYFQFWHFLTIFVLLKMTCLVTLFDRKLQVFQKKSLNIDHFFGIFNKLLSTQNVNLARFARIVEFWVIFKRCGKGLKW